MQKRLAAAAVAVSAAAVIFPCLSAFGGLPVSVPIEQIESYEDTSAPFTHYAPVNFAGSATQTAGGISFHAVAGTTNTLSSHASSVGSYIYGAGSVGNPYVTNVYADSADVFFNNAVLAQNAVSATGPVPGHFDGGAKVINNSYVASDTSNLDDQRRIDFMINRDDVTFVAAAANTGVLAGNYLTWSSYNSLAVRGDADGFDPSTSPGKTHADLGMAGHPSFTAAAVSGYAAGLYGHAIAASQTDAQHGVVMRSLLMSGADKTTYARQTANNLDTQWGAGQANYNTSLAILNGGEQTINTVSGGNITGTATTSLKGWSFGTITAGGQSVVMFHASNPIGGITASLNWNVNSSQPQSNQINTTNAGVIFPDLALELRPLTFTSGHYVLGSSLSDTTLHSNATSDNVEYLYSTSALAAGDYAFLITGDPSLSPSVGFSYNIFVPQVTQWAVSAGGSWNTTGNWTSGVPNVATARANFLASPGLTAPATVTLDGNRTVGQMTFNNANGYTIAAGTGGTLTIDDTGDGGGPNPTITIVTGNHTISAPVAFAAGLTVNPAASRSLTISGNLTGSGGLSKNGAGTLTLSGAGNYGDTLVGAGTLTIAPTGLIASAVVNVVGGATLNVNGMLAPAAAIYVTNGTVNIGANPGMGFLVRTFAAANLGLGAVLAVNQAADHANRTVLVTGAINLGGGTGGWVGKVDLSSNDMIVQNGNLAQITNQIKAGLNLSGAIWSGAAGITSSAAAADTSHLTGLGVLLNDDGTGQPVYGSGMPYGSFDGQSPSHTAVLVKYTYFGDADLNGHVDGADYSLIDNGFNTQLSGWANGDFNYDGVINGADYSLIDAAFNLHGVNLSNTRSNVLASPGFAVTGLASAVPEPSSCGVAAIVCTVTLVRRMRRPWSVQGSPCQPGKSALADSYLPIR